ncbi:asialoglycoprotein receptor 1-like [Bufo bufo]|uniref:asialoglycoprotein receptor 1-like n=1 Tax=Bufo bufo TaxID=8384 RepID=UPI001ABEC40D|nr:asialoglycoprotein receptor 1-like [Bufo bufo]
MDHEFEAFHDRQDDAFSTFRNKGKAVIILRQWIRQPSSILLCALSTLCVLLLIVILVVVSQHAVNQTEKNFKIQNLSAAVRSDIEHLSVHDKHLKDISSSVEKIMTAITRVGSLESDVQRVLSAVGRLADSLENRNESQETLCSKGWTHQSLKCYYIAKKFKTWSNAKKDCEKQEAHLVVINNEEEQNAMSTLTRGLSTWIGLTDVDGEWTWVDGTLYNSTSKFWDDNQPDEWFGHGLGGGEDCGQMEFGDLWNDAHCSLSLPYICEKAIP